MSNKRAVPAWCPHGVRLPFECKECLYVVTTPAKPTAGPSEALPSEAGGADARSPEAEERRCVDCERPLAQSNMDPDPHKRCWRNFRFAWPVTQLSTAAEIGCLTAAMHLWKARVGAAESRGAKARDAEWRTALDRLSPDCVPACWDDGGNCPSADDLRALMGDAPKAPTDPAPGSPSVPAAQPKDQANQGAPTRDPPAPLASLAGPSHPVSLGKDVWIGTVRPTAETLDAATRRPGDPEWAKVKDVLARVGCSRRIAYALVSDSRARGETAQEFFGRLSAACAPSHTAPWREVREKYSKRSVEERAAIDKSVRLEVKAHERAVEAHSEKPPKKVGPRCSAKTRKGNPCPMASSTKSGLCLTHAANAWDRFVIGNVQPRAAPSPALPREAPEPGGARCDCGAYPWPPGTRMIYGAHNSTHEPAQCANALGRLPRAAPTPALPREAPEPGGAQAGLERQAWISGRDAAVEHLRWIASRYDTSQYVADVLRKNAEHVAALVPPRAAPSDSAPATPSPEDTQKNTLRAATRGTSSGEER